MKFIVVVFCFLLLCGCSTGNNKSENDGAASDLPIDTSEAEAKEDLTGYIISLSVDNNIRMLVTGSHANNDGVSATVYTLDEKTTVKGTSEDPLAASDLLVGMKVTVFNSGIVAESFPAQSGAIKVVVDSTQDELERNAIEKALKQVEAGFPWHVEAIEESGFSQYTVTLKNLLDNRVPVKVVEVRL
ncbi:YobA family protein [Sutcliffiella deserti]|uniref:YobA family protein n=1 Tax=Sutcliffiella deserti TaxID=2875501 RepID=UPI001CC05253|nr:YobA family protein [Sutcliffiella deserti]